jgi:hypothetical protein
MDDLSIVYEWAKTYEFSDEELLYATILALKILDQQCKMDYDNYNLFMSVYDGINDKYNTPFNQKVHQIINLARENDPLVPNPTYKPIIHNLRVALMKNMDKPTMKAYKQLIWSVDI